MTYGAKVRLRRERMMEIFVKKNLSFHFYRLASLLPQRMIQGLLEVVLELKIRSLGSQKAARVIAAAINKLCFWGAL